MIIVPTIMRSHRPDLFSLRNQRTHSGLRRWGTTSAWGSLATRLRGAGMILCALLVVCGAAWNWTIPVSASDHGPPAANEATTYPAVEIHEDEKLAIAVDPFDTKEKADFFRVDYLKHRFMPLRIIITNNGDKPVSLNDARIDFISADGDKIPAAEPTDVERRMTNVGRTGKTIPLPAPLPPIHEKPKTADSKIEADFNTYEYAALAVEAHTTRAGFLFYDMQGLGGTPLHGAHLELRLLRNADGKELFAFEVPFDKYLNAKPK
jgi:hypothetical protein